MSNQLDPSVPREAIVAMLADATALLERQEAELQAARAETAAAQEQLQRIEFLHAAERARANPNHLSRENAELRAQLTAAESRRDALAVQVEQLQDLLDQTAAESARTGDAGLEIHQQALALAERNEDLAAQVAELRGVLERLEWYDQSMSHADWDCCPICDSRRTQGHKPDCALRAALDGAARKGEP